MKSYSLLIGSNNARGRFLRRDEKLLQDITARHFPQGFTILNAKGSWYDATSKSFRREDAREVLVCTRRPQDLRRWCRELGRALRQKELLLVETGTARRIRL
jgi:hypothetical protein